MGKYLDIIKDMKMLEDFTVGDAIEVLNGEIIEIRTSKSPVIVPLDKHKHIPSKYEQYLLSNDWLIRKNMALAFYNNKCALCNSLNYLNVHHRTYNNIYNETLNDLIVLCNKCHSMFHGKDNRVHG